MSTIIKAKRSSVQGKVPLTTDLELGEFAINTFDGKLYTKKNVNGTESIVDLSLGTTNLGYSANSSAVTITSDTGSDINVLAANNTAAGVLTATAQTIGGAKTFTGDVLFDAVGGNEGGEIKLAASPTGGALAGSVSIDINQNQLRIFENGGSNRGVYIDLTSAASSVGTNLLATSGATSITTSANGSSVTIISDTGNDGVILAANSTSAGVITAEPQTIGGAKTFTSTVAADQFNAQNNGNGTNFKVGDDAWIGDINQSNTIRIAGQQDSTQGYLVFGSSNATALGRTGTGSLTYGGSAVILASDTDSASTASKIVIRDASRNFSANTITAALAGNATTATTLQTARTIGGVSFDGSANINLPGVNTTGNQNTTGSAATLTTARNINATSFNGSADITIPRVRAIDDRTVAPLDFSAAYTTFGFGSWNNNNTSPYSDYMVFRNYTDASGGKDNMLALRKDALGMRLWQQDFGSNTAFATYKDIAWTDGTNATGTWSISTTGSAATLTTARTITLSGDVGGSASFNGSADVTITTTVQPNSVALGTDTTGNYVANVTGGTGVTITGTAGEGWTPTVAIGQAVGTTSDVEFRNLVLSGNLTINGTTTTVSATELAIEDNLIYLNEGSTITNPDIGIVGNYNDGTYAHTGVFRDATDGRWKFFKGYVPEPGQTIDTANNTFQYADVQANTFYGALSGNATTATTLETARTIAISGDVTGTATSFNGSANITISAGITANTIVNADINAAAAIADTKLATISTAGKVSNSATTATNLNTASAIVARDASGNFSANTITAALTGAASSNVLKAGDTMTGKLNLAGNDSFRLIESLNTSASSAVQFYVEHNLGATNVGNARGVLNLVSNGALTIGGSVALTASNFNTYAPTLTGTGASGNWGINITGNAATVTNGALTTGTLAQFAATTSSQLAGVISDETGSGALVFGTSPSFTTGINAASATMALFDTTATTVDAFGATTTLNLGYDGTAASTTNISTGAVAASTIKTVNIGTGGVTSSTTNINIGSIWGGTTTINSPTIVGGTSPVSLFDTVSATINFAGAATQGNFGYDGTATSITNLSVGATVSGSTKTVNIGTAGASGSITNINIGSATAGAVGNTVINSTSLIVPGNISLGANILATTGPILTLGTLSAGGTGYMNGTHTNQALTGGTGAYMLGTVTVALGVVTGITLTWGGNRYSVGDVLTVPSLTTTIATTATTGDGTTATITFAAQAAAPFEVGSQIIVAGVTPTGYNGTFTVTACTTTSVSFANATTGAQTVAGTVKMGAALTNSTIPVATVQGTDLYISSYTSDSIGARIRLEANDTATVAGQEYGAITFGGRDASTNGSGDLALIRGVGAGAAGGSELQFWTGFNGAAPTISATITSGGNFRLYNSAGTFYSEFSNNPTANRTLTVPDIAGTVSIIQSAATAGYFDTSATTPTGTTRLNYGGYFYPTALNLIGQSDTSTAATHYLVETGSDGFVRPKTLANVQTEIVTSAVLGSGTANSTTYLRGDRTWQTVTSGITITDDTTTNATRYLTFTSATSGSISAENVSSTKLTFNPSTGDFTAGGNVTAYSDIRLKTNIRTIDDALEKVLKLRGVYFDKDGSASLGVIAQEIEEVLPEVVLDGEYKSVAYGNIVGVLIEAIKDQNETINTMQSDIDELKALVKKLMEK